MQLNGNPIDMATLTVAFASCLVRPIRRKLDSSYTGPCLTRDDAMIDFLNGTVLVPFLVLIGTAFSKEMLAMALETTKLFFAIAGGVGFIYIFREFLSSKLKKPEKKARSESGPKSISLEENRGDR